MKQAVLDRVNIISDSMLLHYAAPNNSLVVEVMQMDASTISLLTDDKLSQYILVLGQYLVMLQHNENMRAIEHMLASKTFEHEVLKAKISGEFKVKSEKALKSWLIANDERFSSMHLDLVSTEAEKMVLSGMVGAVEGLLNALKKERSVRHGS